MPVQKVTGKGGAFSYSGTALSFSKWEAKVTRDLADSTDSANYDTATDLVHKSQIPTSIQTEFSVEGKWDLNSTNATLVSSLYSGANAVAAIFKINATVTFGHGNVDISDFTVTEELEDTVSWSATMKTNGVFTPGS